MSNSLKVLASRRYGTLSPLRYPGGKASLAGLFADLIGKLGLKQARYVEPYAGGAGAGIALLREGIVDDLVINDIDPAVHAFWHSVVNDTSAFLELVNSIPLTTTEWQNQRTIYRTGDQNDKLRLGFAFFFLNRTNRSGILNAGVIGGLKQEGTYKIDARFNRHTLVERIQAIGSLAGRITVTDLDGRTVIQRYGSDSSTFMYIDPPYVEAGSRLYLNAFDGRDHQALAAVVNDVDTAHWLMTYDKAPLIESLYKGKFQCTLEISYSAHNPGKAEELLVASHLVGDAVRSLMTPTASVAVASA